MIGVMTKRRFEMTTRSFKSARPAGQRYGIS
jgi:hypothetical protein